MNVGIVSLTQCQKRSLSQVQYRAAKLVTGAFHFSSHGFKINLKEDDLCLGHRSETNSLQAGR